MSFYRLLQLSEFRRTHLTLMAGKISRTIIFIIRIFLFFLYFLSFEASSFTESQQVNLIQDNEKDHQVIHTESSIIKLTAQEKAWMQAHPQVLVGGSPDWTPFNFVDEKGRYSGIASEYLNLLAKKTGLNFKVSIDTWNESLRKIRNKEIDLLGAVYFTEERSQFLNFSKPYFEVLDYFFVRDDLNVKTLKDLNGKRVALPKGYAHIQLIKKYFPEIQIITVDTFGEAIDAVLENKADMLYDTYGSLIYTLEKEGINTIVPFKSTRKIVGKNPIHIVTRKDLPELASIIQKGLNLITSKEKRLIYDKWLRIPTPPSQLNEYSLQLSQEEKDWLKAHPTIYYGAETDWAPYDFVNQQGRHDGVTRDYLNLIEQIIDIRFEPVVNDWDKLLQKAKQQEIDLLPVIYFSQARSQYLKFTQPYQLMLDYFFIRDDLQVKTLSDLNGKIIVIPKGFLHLETVRKKFPLLKIMEVNSLMEAIQSVLEYRADILLDSHSVISYLLKKNSIANIKPFKVLPPAETRKVYMAVPKQNAILADILNKALNAIPELKKQDIYTKWFGSALVKQIPRLEITPKERRWLDQHKVVRFTGDPNWLPYEAFDRQGNYIGIVAEHLKLIEQKLNIKIEFIPVNSWSESIAKVKQGEVDVLSETVDSNLKSELTFTQPYLSSPVVIVMKNNENYVENINKIKHKKIAVIEQYGYVPAILRKYPNINFYQVKNIKEGLTSVSTGKVDVLLATLAQASYHISALGINNVRIVGKTEFTTQLSFGMRKEFEPLVPLFNRALNHISQAQKQQIFSNWGKNKFAEKIDYEFIFKLAAIFILIIFIIVYWNLKLAKEVKLRKEIEAQTQALIDNIPLQIFVTKFDGKILSANPKAIDDYKIKQQDLANINLFDFFTDPSESITIKNEILQHGKIEQKILPFKNHQDQIRSMMLSILPIFYNKEHALLMIAVDMTERLQMEADLKDARDNAEAATRAKSEFLANMSHEIRTPMNAIIGFTELLNEQVTEPKLKSFVKTIQLAGNNLLALINDILDLSKIEAGKLSIEKTPCNPHAIFSELGNIFMMKMQEKNIDFIMDIDPVIPESMQLDATRLRQVLLNLIGNAVKFTDQGYIRLKARTSNEDEIHSKLDLLIDVEDSGIGISIDQQHRIFQDFEQSEGQSVRKYGGTGLGLSISKRLVEMMGGELSLTSQLGHGSTFTIKLTDVDIASLILDQEEPQSPPTTEIVFLASKILIVDDVEDNRNLLIANFSDTQLQVVVAENGLQAVELAKKNDFGLILMDIRMPVMDGYQAAREIKAFTNVPIIALTASVMNDDFERIKTDNFNGYLKKPILKADLVTALSKFLPYEEVTVKPKSDKTVVLSEREVKNAELLYPELEKLNSSWASVIKNNNIAEIKDFTQAIETANQQNPISIVSDYVNDLKNDLDSFDIAAIINKLNYFPELVSILKVKIE